MRAGQAPPLQSVKVPAFERSVFNKLLQTREGGIPLLRDQIEMAARLLEPLLIQLPEAFAAAARAAHKARVLHHAQMFGDGLTRDAGSRGEFADGGRSLLAKTHDQA